MPLDVTAGYDTTRPYIRSVSPAPNASGVDIGSVIMIEFSERMKNSTLNSANIGIYKDPILLLENTTFSYNEAHSILAVTPSGNMDINTRYSVVASGTIQDYYGNIMTMDFWWNFWTGMPSGYVYVSGETAQPSGYVLDGYLQIEDTLPMNYTTNLGTGLISPILLYLNDRCAIGDRNYFGGASGINPASFGGSFFENPSQSLAYYIDIENQEVLGTPNVAETAPTYSIQPSGDIIRIDGNGWLENNEYIVTVKAGLPGLTTYPMQENYQFVFSSTYSPLYTGANILRLNIGPMLQMTMAYIPDDTLNRFIYEASTQADRLHPTTIIATDIPWYVQEFVICQSKLNSLYAAIMLFTSSGAGVKKQLADLAIEIDVRGLMPALLPILEDLRECRDYYKGMVIAGSDSGPKPLWAVKARYDGRRPITDNAWRRLPFTDVRNNAAVQSLGALDQTPKWIYSRDLSRTQYINVDRYKVDGRYVTN